MCQKKGGAKDLLPYPSHLKQLRLLEGPMYRAKS